MTMREGLLFIDGRWRAGIENQWSDIIDPATRRKIGRTAMATFADVDFAVGAAQRAAKGWAETHADERARILLKAADLMAARIDEMARLLTLEQGKPVPDSRKEILFGVEVLRYYAESARRLGGELRPSSARNIKNVVTRQPVGVVGAIVPWNYPVDLYCWKVGPALAAGCPIIVKPPHETPLAIAMTVECLAEAGVPPGVIAHLPGLGAVTGIAMSEHCGIACISATASIAAGQDIMRRSAVNLKRLSLELGGHAPFLVLADADIEAAARAAMRRSFSNMGQICITVNRILVHEAVHRPFMRRLSELTTSIELGQGIDDGVAYGPVLNENVINRVERHIADAVAKGGRVVAGGARAFEGALKEGYFFRPTLIDDAPLDSLPMVEESYGPIAAVRSCGSLEEMVVISNSLDYGLAAYIYSEDLERAWAAADRLEFGAIGINVSDTSELQAPFGGWKLSGLGRELGPEGLAAYLETKHIKMKVDPLIL